MNCRSNGFSSASLEEIITEPVSSPLTDELVALSSVRSLFWPITKPIPPAAISRPYAIDQGYFKTEYVQATTGAGYLYSARADTDNARESGCGLCGCLG